MEQTSRTESVVSEAAVLVGVLLPDRAAEREPLEELEGLAAAAGTARGRQTDPAPRGPRRHHLPGQGQGRGAGGHGRAPPRPT